MTTVDLLTQALDSARADETLIAQLQQPKPAPPVTEVVGFTAGGGRAGVMLPLEVMNTRYRLRPHSSKFTPATVPLSGATPPTNMLMAYRWEGNGKPVHVAGSVFEGTDQMHEYHLADLVGAPDSVIEGSTFFYSGVNDFGSAGSPPGEQFVLGTLHADRLTVRDSLFDGAGHTGSTVGVNSQIGYTSERCRYRGARYGMGLTFWQTSGAVTSTDDDFSENYRPLNMEQCGGMTAHFVRPDFRYKRDNKHLSVRGNNGSAKVIIEDAVTDDGIVYVWCGSSTYGSKANAQKRSDIRVIENGADITNSARVKITGGV